MRSAAVLTLALGLLAVARADDKKVDQFQGDWIIQSVTREGKEDPALKGASRVQEGHKYTINPPAGSKAPRVTGTFEVDATKTPAHFDMKPDGGRYKGKTLLGIAKVEGGMMTICFAEPGKDRPTGFESKPGSGWVVAVHKKAR